MAAPMAFTPIINQDGQITEDELTFIHDPDGLSVPEAYAGRINDVCRY
jgi:hypothetical protein